MDMTASDRCVGLVPADKVLQRQLSTLSKYMSACLVKRISTCLCRSHTLTQYDVQLIQAKATDVEKASQLMQTVMRKGRKTCQLFFKCLGVCNPSLFQTVTGCTGKITNEDHYHLEDVSFPEATETPPSCVINIQNSSLSHCIIGDNNRLCCLLSQNDVTNEKLEPMHVNDQQMTPQDSTEAPSVQVERSNLKYVIIGDSNYMNVESNQDLEEQDYTESESEDVEG